jgi:hypothetical protein
MKISFKSTGGDFVKTLKYLKRLNKAFEKGVFDKYGQIGVEELQMATPMDTGITAASWYYEVVKEEDSVKLEFFNDNVNNNVNIALILQYGHGTGTGGYVEGIDYINPALKPIFEQMVADIWKEVITV